MPLLSEMQADAALGGSLKLQKIKTQVWSPTQASIENEPLLQGRMGVMAVVRSSAGPDKTASSTFATGDRFGALLRMLSVMSSVMEVAKTTALLQRFWWPASKERAFECASPVGPRMPCEGKAVLE